MIAGVLRGAAVLGLVVSFGAGCGPSESARPMGETKPPVRVEADPALLTIGRPVELAPYAAPDIRRNTISGEPFEMQALRGRVVAVNFWATYCAPCVKEMPLLVETYAQKSDSGFVVLGISMDIAGNPEIEQFLERFAVDYPVIAGADLADAFGGVYVLPTTFFVDREGRVVSRINGLIREHVLADVLATVL